MKLIINALFPAGHEIYSYRLFRGYAPCAASITARFTGMADELRSVQRAALLEGDRQETIIDRARAAQEEADAEADRAANAAQRIEDFFG